MILNKAKRPTSEIGQKALVQVQNRYRDRTLADAETVGLSI